MTRPAGSDRRFVWLGVVLTLAACAGAAVPPRPSTTHPPSDPPTPLASPLIPSPTVPSPSSNGKPIATPSAPTAETRPPAATLTDGAVREVEGQVGTFAWQGLVSDSPLLRGSPATVRTAQTITVAMAGPRPTSWTAILYADPTDPARGDPVGQGSGAISLAAPVRPGVWTLAVHVVYPVGDVTHFWQLIVTR